MKSFTKSIYNKLKNGDNVLKKTKVTIDTIVDVKKTSSMWIPKKISDYIENTKGKIYRVTSTINSRNITIYFICYHDTSKETILLYSQYVFLVIYLLTNNNRICSDNLEIKIYLTHFTKNAPVNYTTPFGPNEVNTGFSTAGCNTNSSITIYRKEEWFKVLIHELMHNLNLDFATLDINYAKDKLKEILELKINYEINETYVEIWARIILLLIVSHMKTSNLKDFDESFMKLLDKEISFSITQATKVLKHVNNMKVNNMNKYTEDTHAYAYYVFTAALMNNFSKFLHWCKENNDKKNIFDFKKERERVESFTDLIISSLHFESFSKEITSKYNNSNNSNNKSMRMTSINIF